MKKMMKKTKWIISEVQKNKDTKRINEEEMDKDNLINRKTEAEKWIS